MSREAKAVCMFVQALFGLVALGARPAYAQLQPEQTAPESLAGSVVERVQSLFPQARGWFSIVADAQFERVHNTGLTPDFSVLKHRRVRQHDGAGLRVIPWLPERFSSALRVASSLDPSLYYVELTSLRARDVPARVERGLVVYPDAFPDTDVLYKATPTHLDEYLLLRTAAAPSRFEYRVHRGPGIARFRQVGSTLEAVDAQERALLRVSTPWAVDSQGERRTGSVRVQGDRLVVELDLRGLVAPILVDPDWKSTGDMAYGRYFHRVHTLPDGRILATGGCSAAVCSGDLSIGSCRTVVRATEALDMNTRTFSLAGDSSEPRYFHVSELLADGMVLLAGGCTSPSCVVTNSAELLDPRARAVTPLDPLPQAGAGQASVVLRDGRVLIAGGCDVESCSARVFIFDPQRRTFEERTAMNEARGRAGVVLTSEGRVLVTGGCTDIQCAGVLASAEIYDPATDVWTKLPPLAAPRAGHYIAALRGGRALVGGGCSDQKCLDVLRSSELFEPTALGFVPGQTGLQPRFGAVAVGLPDGNALISQGCSARGECDLTNELYDARKNAFSMLEPAVTERAFHAAVVTPGLLVVANGGCQPSTCSWWNEYYPIKLAEVETPMDATGASRANGGARAVLPSDAGVGDAGRSRERPPTGCACALSGTDGRRPGAFRRDGLGSTVSLGLAATMMLWGARRRAKRRKEHGESTSRRVP